MNKYLQSFYKILGVAALTAAVGYVNAQDIASTEQTPPYRTHRNEIQKEQPLNIALKEIGEKFKIKLAYNRKIVDGKVVVNVLEGKNADEMLTRLLKPFGLLFEKVDPKHYVIYLEDERKKNIKKLKKKKALNLTNAAATPSAVKPKVQRELESGKAEDKTITGQVKDENSEPLPGVNILVKGTTIGTVSDANGEYALVVPENTQTLLFSYVGYLSEEVSISGRSVIDITLVTDISTLSEIVVVGYDTQRKREVTGAISSISSETLSQQMVTGFDQAMVGRLAGVQISQASGTPGGATSVRIRGIGTPGNSEPLYVIDGVPVFNNNGGRQSGSDIQAPGALNALNPSDIASIEVLKDAASAAIYGSRAANGVILVTTKKGESGKTRFNLDYSFGVQSKEKDLDVLDGPTYQEYIREYNRLNSNPDDDNGIWTNPANTDWEDEIFRTAPVHSLNLSVSGGNENSTYLLSTGYFNQEGIVRGSGFERLSLRFNSTHKIGKKFRIGNNTNISRTVSRQVSENQIFGTAIPLTIIYPPIIPARRSDGNLAQPGDVGYTFLRTNPLVQTDANHYEADQFRLLGNVFAEYDIIEGLAYRLNLGGDFLYGGSDYFQPEIIGNGSPGQIAEAFRFDSREWIWLVEHTLNYTKSFGDHDFNLLAGFTQQESNYSLHESRTRGFASNETIALNGGATIAGVNGQLIEWSLMSLLGRINYNYKDRYFLSASIRRDGSSRFGPGNRWGTFPSFSGGWLISEEAFFDVPYISSLKLRASWGQLGNQEISPFQYLPLLVNTGGYPIGGEVQTGLFAPQPANENITWETSTQTDFGVDLELFESRLMLSVDYFDKETDGILLDGTLPLAYGFIRNSALQFPVVNAGVVSNKGMEFDVGIRDIKGDFQWSFNANLATLDNEVESLGDGGPIITYEEALSTRTDVGEAIGSFFGYVVEGVFQNQEEIDALNPDPANDVYYQDRQTAPGDFKFRDLDGDGVITDADQEIIGSPVPDITYGFSFEANYKNFDFSIAFQGIAGNRIFAKVFQQGGDLTKIDNKFTTIYENRWRGEGTSNTVPRVDLENANNNYRNSDYFIFDGSFLRLRSLQIGYTLPEDLLKQFNMAKMRVYVGGQNLLTFDDYEFGLDPDVGASRGVNGSGQDYGVDSGNYPVPRTITLGVNIGF